jgi:hypothetical protein
MPEPFHMNRCTIPRSRVNAAADTPVPISMNTTANQNGPAPGRKV